MKRFLKILFALVLLLPATLSAAGAETMSLYGVVKDATTGAPVAWATIAIKDGTMGATTSAEGEFSLKAKEGDVLIVNCLGYEPRHVAVTKSNSINIKIKQSSVQIDEVVAIGYGKLRKSDLTGATSRVTEDDFAQRAVPVEMASMLEGRMAGVNISSGEGGANSAFSIQIRGASSVGASSEPLYVIDGVPLEQSSLTSQSNGFESSDMSPISNIDPSTIESIEVLKDASSTAIYGSRGANGVVLVTTKGGKSGKGVVSFTSQWGVSTVASTADVLDSRGFAEYMWHRSFVGESDPYAAEREAKASGDTTHSYYNYETYRDSTSTDWQSEIYRIAVSQNYNLNVSGGTEKTRYSVGAGYLKNEGTIINNDFKRYSLNTKLNSQINNWLTADLSASLAYTRSNGVATGVGGSAATTGIVLQALRCSPLKSPDSTINWDEVDLEDTDDVSEASTPLTFANDVTDRVNTTRILASLAFTAKILPGLTFRSSFGTNHNLQNYEAFYPSSTGKGSSYDGYASRTYQDERSWVYDGIFNYNKSFSPKRRLSATAAFSAEEKYTSYFAAENSNYLYEDLGVDNMGMGTTSSSPSTAKSKSSLSSLLARVNYTHNNKYLFTLSARADGSSRFAQGNKWAVFPSAAFAWRLSEEEFFQSIKRQLKVSNVKFRSSFGVTGNQAISNYSTMGILNAQNYTFNDVVISGLNQMRINNDDLKWESTAQYDFGLDIGLLNNRFNIVVDYYNKQTSDMLMDVEIPASTGYDEYIMNYGSMENKGWEISADATLIKKKSFTWRMGYNMSFNRNKVLSIGGGDYIDNGYSRIVVGESIGQFYGYKQIGMIENAEQLALYSGVGAFASYYNIGQRKFADLDPSSNVYENGVLRSVVIDSDDMAIIGSYEPKFVGGMSQSFAYKNLRLDMQFKFRLGGDIYNAIKPDMITYEKDFNNRLSEALDYWDAVTNPTSLTPHPSSRDMSEYIDLYIEDGSFLKLSSLTLTYNVNKRHLAKIGLSACRVYIRGNNLLLLTKYSGTDPEADMGASMAPGYDRGGQPFARGGSIGVNLNF